MFLVGLQGDRGTVRAKKVARRTFQNHPILGVPRRSVMKSFKQDEQTTLIGGGSVCVVLSGPDGARDFLSALFEP